MKNEVVNQLFSIVNGQTTDREAPAEYGFTREEIELLIKATVDRCITVIEAEIDAAANNNNGELYAALVDIAFKTMDEFGIDELEDWDEDELMRQIEEWKGQDDK